MTVSKKILVSGGDGLLARAVLQLLQENHELHALVRSEPKLPVDNVEYHKIDLATAWDDKLLPQQMDVVIHLAQSSRMRDFPGAAKEIFAVNTQSTVNLLNYAHSSGAGHFIYTSTGGLYAPSENILTEESPLGPIKGDLNYYFASKHCSEIIVRSYEHMFNTVILRPFFIFGPGQNEIMLIPRLIGKIQRGEAIGLVGDSGTKLNPIHVSDAATAISACLKPKAPKLLNLAGPSLVDIRTLAELIGNALNTKVKYEIEPGTTVSLTADIARLRTVVSSPMIDIQSGISTLVEQM